MNSWIDSILNSPLDLSSVLITQPGPGLLWVTSKMTTGRCVMAILCGIVASGFLVHAWLHRAVWWDIIWPHLVMIPVFGLIAIVIGFGFHQKAIDARHRDFRVSARLGPLSATRHRPLPAQETIKLTFRKVYPSRGAGKTGNPTMPVTWYDIDVVSVPGLRFTLASRRDLARAFAKTLADTLQWPVDDQVEDDGIDRLPSHP